MGTTYNRKRQKGKRQYLRTHMTLAEKTLWHLLKGRQLLGYKFRRQHGITDYVVDFYCPELKLVIEADGESHNSSEATAADRKERDALLEVQQR
jgi:very-short-patch-repair endonuclease